MFENVAESAVISVYNSGKHLVRSFSGGELDGGKVEWNGEDKRGVRIAPGVYHYIIKNGGKTKKGKIFYGCNNYPKCNFASWDMPTGERCPNCNSLLVENKKNIKCAKCEYIKEK